MSARRIVPTFALGIALLGSLLTACGDDRSAPDRAPLPAPNRAAALGPPSTGALLGAYVAPARYTEAERIEVFAGFEEKLGRQLAIYHDYHTWTDPFPSESDVHFAKRGTTLLLSWAGTDTKEILSGADDTMIKERAAAVAALGTPVLLRWRWEMNRPNLADEIHSPADYVAAWRHIHDLFDQVGAANVAWVWCPLSSDTADPDFAAYYPGDDDVDWLCTDGYARGETQTFQQVFARFLNWAARISEPVMIGEFGRAQGAAGSRAAWLADARAFIEKVPQIKAAAYYESATGASGNYSLAGEKDALAELKGWAHDPYFDPH